MWELFMNKATAIAGSNIAFVKYWGKLNSELRLPLNGSISMTLDNATTTTTVDFLDYLSADELYLNDTLADETTTARVSKHLDQIRKISNSVLYARISSQNSFPTGAGIASSASSFAALTTAACKALDLQVSKEELSRLSRLGSGSACRSIYGGFVEWLPGGRHEDSYAQQISPPDHWNLADIVTVVSDEHKEIPSTKGHTLAQNSPFLLTRLGTLQTTLSLTKAAICNKDFSALGILLESEAFSLHAIAMTSDPGILYWTPATVRLIHQIRKWRTEGLQAYFTIDAGPNIHIITLTETVPAILERLEKIEEVKKWIVCSPGDGVRLSNSHLF